MDPACLLVWVAFYSAGKDNAVQAIIADLHRTFVMNNKGAIQNFLGICIDVESNSAADSVISFTQSGLIDSILQQLNLNAFNQVFH